MFFYVHELAPDSDRIKFIRFMINGLASEDQLCMPSFLEFLDFFHVAQDNTSIDRSRWNHWIARNDTDWWGAAQFKRGDDDDAAAVFRAAHTARLWLAKFFVDRPALRSEKDELFVSILQKLSGAGIKVRYVVGQGEFPGRPICGAWITAVETLSPAEDRGHCVVTIGPEPRDADDRTKEIQRLREELLQTTRAADEGQRRLLAKIGAKDREITDLIARLNAPGGVSVFGWFVISSSKGPAKRPHIHESFESAATEAKRLALLYGERFWVAEVTHMTLPPRTVTELVVELADRDEIPF